MRVLELPTAWTVLMDITAWLVIHLGVSYLVMRAPAHFFEPRSRLFRERRWERNGALYEAIFRVRRWKP